MPFSSPEPKAHWYAYRIGRPLSSVVRTLSTSPPQKPIKFKFHMEPPWDGRMKVCSNGPGHMTKMATVPIYGKNLNKSSSLEPKGDDLETWYAVSDARVLPSLFKWWPWVDHDPFYRKVKFGPLCFCMGKIEKGKTKDSSMIWNQHQVTKVTRIVCWHQNFVPWGLSGLYTCIKSWKKNCIKSGFKDTFLTQQMTEVTRSSCWHQNFVLKGLSAPGPGLYTCIKSLKICIKSNFKENFF